MTSMFRGTGAPCSGLMTIDQPTRPYTEFAQAKNGVNIIGPGDGMICRRCKTFDEAAKLTDKLNRMLAKTRITRAGLKR